MIGKEEKKNSKVFCRHKSRLSNNCSLKSKSQPKNILTKTSTGFLSPQSPQPLLQLILLLGRRLIRLSLRFVLLWRSLVEFSAELEARIVCQFAEEFVDGVLADLCGGGLGDGVLVDAVVHGVFLVLLLELFESGEGLEGKES